MAHLSPSVDRDRRPWSRRNGPQLSMRHDDDDDVPVGR